MSDGMATVGRPLFFATSAFAPAMSSTRVPRPRPPRVLPPASNVANLHGVSGLLETVSPLPRCARAGATRAIVRTTRITRRIGLLSCNSGVGLGPYDTAARLGDSRDSWICHHRCMTNDLLSTFSNQLADAVAPASPSVVQVQGRRRPASGLVYADGVVLTTVRALGREDGLHVRRDDGQTFDAELAGGAPTTSLAVLRVAGLGSAAIAPAAAPA